MAQKKIRKTNYGGTYPRSQGTDFTNNKSMQGSSSTPSKAVKPWFKRSSAQKILPLID